jgi:hypothetical protein
MAFNISGLINNISNSVSNLISSLTGTKAGTYLYPNNEFTKQALTTVNPENWLKLPFPYSFDVLNTVSNDFGQGNGGFKEFQLPLAPTKINQVEHFAVSIKPTQGGTVVSHSGNKYKTLTISGTTGQQPFRGAGGVEKSTGNAIFQPDEFKYKSGYEVFLHLRNYFKAYYEFKKNARGDGGAQNLRLVFKNYKDGEFLIVELLDFQMDRQAGRPFLYDYNMSFKVLGHFSFTNKDDNIDEFSKKLAQASAIADKARGVFLRSQDILRQIESTYESTVLEPVRKTSLAIKAFQGIGPTAMDMGNRIIRKTVTSLAALGILGKMEGFKASVANGTSVSSTALDNTTLPSNSKTAATLSPADTVIGLNEGLSLLAPEDFPETTQLELQQEMTDVQTLPRSFYEDALADLQRIKNNAEDFFGLGSSTYDALFDRTSTVTADTSKVITDEEFDLLEAFNLAIRAMQNVLASDTLFKSNFDARIQTILTSFENQIALQALPAVQQIIMPGNTDLEKLAQIYLNSSSRWVEIAELNDLRAPYVIQDMSDTTSNVVHPGDTILIPINPTNGFSKLPEGKEITSGPSLSELERSLGTDLKLTDDFDLALGNNGDLQIVRGADNVAQAVVLKLAYEPGEVMRSPGLGVGLGVGKKFPPIGEIKDNLIRSLTQDPRIDKIENLRLERNNSELRLSFDLKIKQIDIPVPVVIKI